MAIETKLTARKREVSGSSASRRLRREGWLPCVVSDEKGRCELIQMNCHDFELMLKHHRSESLNLDLEIDGRKPEKVLLKEVQHDAVTDETLHADFVGISMMKKMRIRIPIVLVGEAIGVKEEDGVLDHLLRELEIECLPGDLVEAVEVNVSELKIGDTRLVSELNLDPKLTVLTAGDVAVAGVSMPRIEEEVVPEEAVEKAEPEVIGEEEKKEEGEEEGKEKGQRSAAAAKASAPKEVRGQPPPRRSGAMAPREGGKSVDSGATADKTEDTSRGKSKESKRGKRAEDIV